MRLRTLDPKHFTSYNAIAPCPQIGEWEGVEGWGREGGRCNCARLCGQMSFLSPTSAKDIHWNSSFLNSTANRFHSTPERRDVAPSLVGSQTLSPSLKNNITKWQDIQNRKRTINNNQSCSAYQERWTFQQRPETFQNTKHQFNALHRKSKFDIDQYYSRLVMVTVKLFYIYNFVKINN